MSRTALGTGLRRWKFILLFSSLTGSVCGLVGTTLGVMSLLKLLSDYRLLDDVGTALLVVAFPMLVLAAHSLDKAHEVETTIRMEGCRPTGMIENEEK